MVGEKIKVGQKYELEPGKCYVIILCKLEVFENERKKVR